MQPVLNGVTHRVPGTPGLGVEFNEDAPAVKKAFEFRGEPTPAPPRRLAQQLVTPPVPTHLLQQDVWTSIL